MDKKKLIEALIGSDIFLKWHWFAYHFNYYKNSLEHPFAGSLLDALLLIDDKVEGYALEMVARIASYSGREKYLPHYEQLLQLCAEIYVISQAVKFFYNDKNISFVHEPSGEKSKKNPEILIQAERWRAVIEVKSPSLIKHINERATNPYQCSTRIPDFPKILKNNFGEAVTLPRDNPVKDFLVSSNQKFYGIKQKYIDCVSILFILWDDFIYEPISAILGEPSGLFLEGSFARDGEGNRVKFDSVDGVFIDRHLTNIINATRESGSINPKLHAMDYGNKNEFPFKIIIKNPSSTKEIPQELLECFQVTEPNMMLGAEYIPSDLIFWRH